MRPSRLPLLALLSIPALVTAEVAPGGMQLVGFKNLENKSPSTTSTPAIPAKPAEPAAPARAPEKASAPENAVSHLAKLDLTGVELRALEVDEKIWSDRDVRITKVPEKYRGLQFTQYPAHGLTATFKVLTPGTVVMGCSSRWGTTAAPEVAKDFQTAKSLLEQGWIRQPREEVETASYDMQYLIFTRECKAGEEFTIRTDKYAPPILITR